MTAPFASDAMAEDAPGLFSVGKDRAASGRIASSAEREPCQCLACGRGLVGSVSLGRGDQRDGRDQKQAQERRQQAHGRLALGGVTADLEFMRSSIIAP